MNRGPSAYQSNALPLGQTDSPLNLRCTSPKNSHGVRRGCAGTLTFNEGNIHCHKSWVCIHPDSVVKATSVTGRMLWVCIHPYSVVKATSVAVHCGCAIVGYPYSIVKATSVAVHCGCAIVGYPYSVVKATSVAVHCRLSLIHISEPTRRS